MLSPIPYGSVFFAPMEGITDETFRKVILKLYPEWDYLACDFLRVPAAGSYPAKHLIRHFGTDLIQIPWVREKTMYQILTSKKSFTDMVATQVQELGIPWLDVNLGCPSKTVCKHGGGSFLLTDLASLRPIIKGVRDNFKGRFTAKIRIGFNDTSSFEDSIKLLNDEGVDMITVHGRTREDMYQTPARWEYIARAVQLSQVPIIGNGDTWKAVDIDRMLKETGCHGVMVARGALKFPWMAQDYRRGLFEVTPENHLKKVKDFLLEYQSALEEVNVSPRGILKQSKSISRFMFDDVPAGEVIRRKLLLSQTVPNFFEVVKSL